jgi:hypothetical protein
MPLISGARTPASKLIGIRLAELSAPLANGLIGHDHATGEQHLFDIPITEAKAEVQPDAMTDDLSREAVVFIGHRQAGESTWFHPGNLWFDLNHGGFPPDNMARLPSLLVVCRVIR